MKISDILKGLDYEFLSGSDAEIQGIAYDSRKITPGCAFFCMPGFRADGHDFAGLAVEAGAKALIVSRPVDVPAGVSVVRVSEPRQALSRASAMWYGEPSKKLKVVGVTGTKGKTTFTYMLRAVLEAAGHKTGLIGTIETIVDGKATPSKNTTPESCEIQRLMREMVDAGCTHAVMEVSSQGLGNWRVEDVDFEYGVFTNLGNDHIAPGEHKDFADYMECKKRLFRKCRHGVFNADDRYFPDMIDGATCTIETYAVEPPADTMAMKVELRRDLGFLGVSFDAERKDETVHVDLPQPGKFSVSNALAVVAVARGLGVNPKTVSEALHTVRVRGRVEILPTPAEYTVMIEYAHNALSMQSIMETMTAYQHGRMIAVFGGGGNRAVDRRYDMGEIAGKYCDLCILTMDNPRDESIDDIDACIELGLKRSNGKSIRIDDRAEAICWALDHAEPSDIIMLIGKGHETYQEIKGVKYYFDEREVVNDYYQKKGITL